jgi:hypothetical protein
VEEGDLSFYEVAHFFPHDVKLKGHDLVAFGSSAKKPSYSGLCKTAKNLAVFLQVTYLPAPDLLCLAKRYIEELQLPGLCFIFSVLYFLYLLLCCKYLRWTGVITCSSPNDVESRGLLRNQYTNRWRVYNLWSSGHSTMRHHL